MSSVSFPLTNYYEHLPPQFVNNKPRSYPNEINIKIKIPFTMSIVGPKGAFKTNTLANIRDVLGCFTRFYLYCPDLRQPIYSHMIDTLEKVSEKTKQKVITIGEKITDVPSIESFDPVHNNLLIIDDMSTEDLSQLNHLFTNGRRKNITIIIIVHRFFTMPLMMRDNLDYVILKDIRSRVNLINILKTHSHEIDIEEIIKLYNRATRVEDPKDELNFFLIDIRTRDPDLKYRKNFSPFTISPLIKQKEEEEEEKLLKKKKKRKEKIFSHSDNDSILDSEKLTKNGKR